MTRRYEIFFEDECRIPCGLRRVECRVGHKWVYIKTPFADRRVKIKRALFDKMKPRELES